ncbi:MAG: thermonuclease family protein, partial [Candidatus Aminicenantes bacterium]|nr:thermonuclease family protein [Candidatus Aminicenantes bacterium]
SFPFPRNGILKIDYEFILIFKKHGIAPKVSREIKEKSKMTIEEWNQFFTGHWNISGEKQNKHIAMFPEEVPRRLIKMFSFVNDTVLDPFLGSGTTSFAAKKLERSSVGYEINPEFLPLIKGKLGIDQKMIFEETHFEIVKQNSTNTDYKKTVKQLPYTFKDPVKFDKKVDPRKLNFGSKIDNCMSKREEYYTIKKITSPERLVLDNGLKVKLLGVKEKPKVRRQAIEFLRDKTHGRKVFMKFDAVKYDQDNNLLCYLYLQNKTFLNAHLIKEGLLSADAEIDFKYKKRFMELAKEKVY